MTENCSVIEDYDEFSLPYFMRGKVDTMLADHQQEFATKPHHILVSTPKGEKSSLPMPSPYPSCQKLNSSSQMKQQTSAYFRVKTNESDLDDITLILLYLNTNRPLNAECWQTLEYIDRDYKWLIKKSRRLQSNVFHSISEPCYNFRVQSEL